ncbi:MAG TPA: phosphotransferase [Candidatus Anaerobutyricum stercoripullorum]|uniref:Phosphotransferase n=1 Tax=Candidatus Anaerobutyricum stercoripullorum TaxID=2838456 RepID=A0A9D2BE73_9FIRM|nr:phosphotransferase [Candidatus Anaerobutyricum stercoripullorum]
MIILTRDNVVSYIKDHVPSIKLEAPVQVNVIGEGELSEDVEGDGYCNFVFRVADKNASYIVKQSTSHLRRRGKAVTPKRNRYEYEIMQLRSKIVPQYVPTLYHGDFENNVFIMEDVSNLKLVRYQMNENHRLPELASQVSQYLAATHFYTSEFYLESEKYRSLLSHFMNAEIRHVMEDGIFLGIFGADEFDPACGPEFAEYCGNIYRDTEITFQRFKLRHLFMSKSETLIHGDFHTSNMFADDTHLKVIDMEYTFGAPFSYDLGFIMANFISQFCSAAFRPFENESDRKGCLSYLITIMHLLYTDYIGYFTEYWEKDAKLEYKLAKGYKESLFLDILRECFGFAACANLCRVCGSMQTADFDHIEDNDLRTQAKSLSVEIDELLFRKWFTYNSIDEPLDDMIALLKKHKDIL